MGPHAGGAGHQAWHPSHDDRGLEAAGDRRHGLDLCGCLGGGAGERRGGDRQAAFQDRAAGRGTGFFSQSLRSMSVDRRRGMVAVHAYLSISAQCRLLSISRSSFYYAPQPESGETLALMRMIDAAFLDMPWYGSRQMVRHLRRQGVNIGRGRVRRLMTKMGLVADLPAAADQRSSPAASDLPVSAAASGNRSAEPGVVRRHHLHPDAARLPVPGGDHGLGDPQGAGLASVEHHGRRVLRHGVGGSADALRQPRDLQHGPGQPGRIQPVVATP